MLDQNYSPAAWFWQIGDDASRYWSSAAAAWVTDKPRDYTRIASEAALREVLSRAGYPERAPGYVPATVPLWKAREQIRRAGLFPTVDAAIQAFGGAPLSAWEYAQEMRRDSDLMDQFALILKLSDAQIDALFIAADKIEV